MKNKDYIIEKLNAVNSGEWVNRWNTQEQLDLSEIIKLIEIYC